MARPELYTNDFEIVYGKIIDCLKDGFTFDEAMNSIAETFMLFDDEFESLYDYMKEDFQVNHILSNR